MRFIIRTISRCCFDISINRDYRTIAHGTIPFVRIKDHLQISLEIHLMRWVNRV